MTNIHDIYKLSQPLLPPFIDMPELLYQVRAMILKPFESLIYLYELEVSIVSNRAKKH